MRILLLLAALLGVVAFAIRMVRRDSKPRSRLSQQIAESDFQAPVTRVNPSGDVQQSGVNPQASPKNSALNLPSSGADDRVSSVLTGTDVQRPPIGDDHAAKEAAETVAPIKRGGRLRSIPVHVKVHPAQHKVVNPEVVCWQSGNHWCVGIELPESWNSETVSVTRDGVLLVRDERNPRRWLLDSLQQKIAIMRQGDDGSSNGPDLPLSIAPPGNGYWIFRLGSLRSTESRRVKSIRSGYYLLATPRGWILDADRSHGVETPIQPEECGIPEARVTFLWASAAAKLVIFQTPDGGAISVPTSGARFSVVGEQATFTPPDDPPLFLKEAPSLLDASPRGWSDISVIVLCEERTAQRRRWQIFPSGAGPQRLPEEVRAGSGGWYSARIYDKANSLAESLDFQFLAGLHSVNLEHARPVPGPDGYPAVPMLFTHDRDIRLTPITEKENSLSLMREANRTTIVIPPREDADRVQWLARFSEEHDLSFTVFINRIWWALSKNPYQCEWIDRPLVLKTDWFDATSTLSVFVKTLERSGRSTIRAAVCDDYFRSRAYYSSAEGLALAIPLREFGDSPEILQFGADASMYVWIPDVREPCKIARIVRKGEDKLESPTVGSSFAVDGQLAACAGPSNPRYTEYLLGPLPRDRFEPIRRMSQQQMREFQIRWRLGQVVTSRMVNPEDLQEVFQPIAFGELRRFHSTELSENMVFIFSYDDDPRTRVKVAGKWPSFTRCRLMHKADWEILRSGTEAKEDVY